MRRFQAAFSVSGGSRHADPPRVGARPRTGLVSRIRRQVALATGGVSRLVVSVDALNPIQLAAGNVGAGAGQPLT